MEIKSFASIPSEGQILLLAASAVKEHAYNPYSHFFVGAALLTYSDDIVTGTNYESASYGATICAERAAIVAANTKGFRQFKALAVIARGEANDMPETCSPCGLCRQLLFEAAELSGGDFVCYLSNTAMTKIRVTTVTELFPLPFGPSMLKIDLQPYHPKESQAAQTPS